MCYISMSPLGQRKHSFPEICQCQVRDEYLHIVGIIGL
jgi:hypothetical protein